MSTTIERLESPGNELDGTGSVGNWLDGVAIVGLMALYLQLTTWSAVDLDMWHQMALAREFFTLGYLPWRDNFSYCETIAPIVHHEWGAGIIAYVIATKLGASGLAILRLCLTCGLAILVWITARKREASVALLSLLLPMAMLLSSYGFSPIRAQIYSYFLVALMFFVLESGRLQSSGRWAVVWLCLFVIWINLHGGFLAGAGLSAVYWAECLLRGRTHWRLFWIGVAMAPLILINPYGIHYVTYLWNALRLERPLVSEWHSVWGMEFMALCYLGLSVSIGIFACWHAGLRRSQGILPVTFSLLATFSARRFLPIYAIVWAIYVPSWLEGSGLATFFERAWIVLWKWFAVAWVGFIALFGCLWIADNPFELVVPSQNLVNQGNHIAYPVGAVEYLRGTRIPTNLMVGFDTGAYVSWKLYPQVKVSIDSRYEAAYPPGAAETNYTLYLAQPGWERILEECVDTDAILVANSFPLAQVLPRLENWNRVYYDASYSVYARKGSSYPVRKFVSPVVDGTIP